MSDFKEERWNYALVQHPMWLIIAEDMVCAERTPPWGCPLGEYVERLRDSLGVLDRYPELRLSFDFSAVELEDVAARCPELIEHLRVLASRGRVAFVNGTYSQPHLQMLSIESAIRQFDYGVQSIEALTGCRVRCYAAQEPGITPYLPQVLRARGYASSSTPSFPYGVRLIGGRIQHWDGRWEWLAGDDVVSWQSPDGTAIPLWLKTSGFPDESSLSDERQHGLLGHSRLRVDMPDMMEVSPEWVEERARACEFVLLDEVLDGMVDAAPRAVACLDANYAYCEGVDAEELSRANMRAESALLALESLRTLVDEPSLPPFDFDAAWKTLLQAQHHDAYWTGAPELRAKAIAWLGELRDQAVAAIEATVYEVARRLPTPAAGESPVLVAGAYAAPHRAPVSVAAESTLSALVDEHGNEVPAQIADSRATFIADCPGLGYRTYFLRAGKPCGTVQSQPLDSDHTYSNNHYSITVCPNGSVRSLSPLREADLLGEEGGNQWLFAADAKDVPPQARSARLTKGPVFDCVDAELALGPARIHSSLLLYHDLPWFEVRTDLVFDSPAEIGDYFDDRTKLHFAWSLSNPGVIRHAVGGWPSEADSGRTFVTSSWVDAGGLALCLPSAGKCWVDKDDTLRCVVGWGHDGDRFHNRQGPLPGIMGPLNWIKPMDLRLMGSYSIRYAAWPHGGSAQVGEIAGWAASQMMPPMAFAVAAGNGDASWSSTQVSVGSPGLLPLSVMRGEGGTAMVRLAELAGESHDVEQVFGSDMGVRSAQDLDGTPVHTVSPYKIVEVTLRASPA